MGSTATRPLTREQHSDDERVLLLIGTVRRVHEEAAHVERALAGLAAAALLDSATAKTAVTKARHHLDLVLGAEAPNIDAHFTALTALIDTEPQVCEIYGDAVERLRNIWGDAVEAMPKTGTGTAAASAALGQLALETAYLTIPQRLGDKLQSYWPGQALDVRESFSDEYSDDIIAKVLSYLAALPRSVSGIVDPVGMVVYRASSKTWRRLVSLGVTVGIAALGAVVATYAGDHAEAFGLPGGIDGAGLRGAYLLAVGGAVGHILVQALKQVREHSAADRFVSIDNWIVWLHVKELKVWGSMFAIWIATFAAVAAMKKIPDATTMLLVGYTADSIADLVLPKLTKSIADRGAALRAKVGPAPLAARA
jgi:hypothetical protein